MSQTVHQLNLLQPGGEFRQKLVNGHIYKYVYYQWKGFEVIIDFYNGYHLTIWKTGVLPTYEILKKARYYFIPDNCYMAEIYPPSKEFININPFARQLYQVNKEFNKEME